MASASTPSSQAEYDAFLERVKRTVYVDTLSPQVTESVLRSALGQFGNVRSVQFIPNYLEPRNIPRSALVELQDGNAAKEVVEVISQLPFMIYGMPRPVRARMAEVEMFDDRPIRPGRVVDCHWLDPKDPDFDTAQKLKLLAQKHAAESSFLVKQQLGREEKLAMKQSEMLKANYKKFEMIDGITADKTAHQLARHYDIRLVDDP